jgi:hypothetical protein
VTSGDGEVLNDTVTSAERVKAAEEAIGDTVADSVLASLGDADAVATMLTVPAGEAVMDKDNTGVPVPPALGETAGDSVADEVLLCEELPDTEAAAVALLTGVPEATLDAAAVILARDAEAAALRESALEAEVKGEREADAAALLLLASDGEPAPDTERCDVRDGMVVADAAAAVAVAMGEPVAREALAAAESEKIAEGLRKAVRDTKGLEESLL